MGVKSGSYTITRETALEVIMEKIDNCSNEQLSDILDVFEESTFRNYNVVNEVSPTDDSQKVISSVYNFNSVF